ncbi:n(4)-(Beta-N-acetylglucosaminyl)-L-asparaginase [Trichonephila inaurata madagascariensis]|uniref:N(4)-(beta-N-acetylglucosaminyl)-L-asparaginase n=1 Tax=Trichonephila inaurata madagascariensis TaxID=2747483 RepID=A0A8X7CUB9_9ARAC|nr:n(4)-(Beta-N-acetylglucosaminyl)-L-asparaginase [Trichonephila inaurata madagascariensis]
MTEGFNIPLVINTWGFTNGTAKAWDAIINGRSALDAVEEGCSQCEIEQCDHTVGYGGSPDENGETTLDAMIMDGVTHNVGGVAALRRVKSAISVARKVLENTKHSLLVGDQATQFALSMGFKEESLATDYSLKLWKDWKQSNCQPNFWVNVVPDPKESCGPYKDSNSIKSPRSNSDKSDFGIDNHDTIGMIVIDSNGRIAGGTSSNGAKFKIPGRVGDSPIPGSGVYVDQNVGGAAATGDGDVMMRFVPSYNTVENMRNGMNPTQAANDSINRIIAKYPSFSGAIIAATINGEYGAACHGMEKFPFSVVNRKFGNVTIETVTCM